MVRKMHPTLLLPTLLRFVILLAIVLVRVFITPASLKNSLL